METYHEKSRVSGYSNYIQLLDKNSDTFYSIRVSDHTNNELHDENLDIRIQGKYWKEIKEEILSEVANAIAVKEFKEKTEECFHKIDDMSVTDIEKSVTKYVEHKIYENDFDARIVDVVISGSRCRGLERKDSDLDIVVQFSGNEREDDMFNLLHEDRFKIGGILVDINPITEYKTGTLGEYLPGVEKYLSEKAMQMELTDSIMKSFSKEKKRSTIKEEEPVKRDMQR